jgi:hypothetical protein
MTVTTTARPPRRRSDNRAWLTDRAGRGAYIVSPGTNHASWHRPHTNDRKSARCVSCWRVISDEIV